jgi:CheY-like chemotaxis protein
MWRSGRHALLLTDCHMPNMDGFELAEAIRRSEAPGHRFPIVAITANAMQGEAQRCRERGMDDYLCKPLRLTELGPLLTKWLPLPERVDEAPSCTTAASEPVQACAWDSTTLGQLVGDNPKLHRRLLEKFLLHAQAQVSQLGRLAEAGDSVRAGDVAHTLKSAARTVGAQFLGELCQALETAGRGGDLTGCRLLAPEVAFAFEAAEHLIRHHLDGGRQSEASRNPDEALSP